MNIKRYCKNVKKRTKKALCKLFGTSTIAESIKERNILQESLECFIGKKIEDFNKDDIKEYAQGYSMWITMDKLINLYMEATLLEIKSKEVK